MSKILIDEATVTLALELLAVATFIAPKLQAKRTDVINAGLKALAEQPAQQKPVNLRRGDLLRCIETDELCTVWATSTTGKTLIKWSANNFGNYTAEQIGELFWLEPTQDSGVVTANGFDPRTQRTWVGLTEDEVFAVSNTMPYGDRFNFAEAIEAKLRSKNT